MNTFEHFGEHLTIDGYNGSQTNLANRQFILDCLNNLPKLLGMKKLSDAVVYYAPGNMVKDPGGWSGFVVIIESHISIHTFPDRGFISADVYTCKNGLEVDLILNFFKDSFQLIDIEHQFIKRGMRYPSKNIY